MSPVLQALVTEVTDAKTVVDSAVAFINGVPGLIDAAVQKAIGNGATEAQLQPVSDLGVQLKVSSDALQAALVANTPNQP